LDIIIGRKPIRDSNFVSLSTFEGIPGDNYSISLGINELNRLGHVKIENKTIPNILFYDSMSLWWLCYNPLSQFFIETISFIDNFNNFIKKTNPKGVIIRDDFKRLDLIVQICKINNINCSYSKFNYFTFFLKSKFKQSLKFFKAKIKTKQKIKNRLIIASKYLSNVPSLKGKNLFVSYSTYRRKIFNLEDYSTKSGEFIFAKIQKILGNKNSTIGLDIFSNIKSNDCILDERLSQEGNWIPFEILFNDKLKKKFHKEFLKKFKKLLKSKLFQTQFKYKGINYWSSISNNFFEMTFDYHIPLWLKLYDSILLNFSKNPPKFVILLYETGPSSLSIIYACKKLGIKTLGFQHGIIHSHHPFYMHDQFLSPSNQFGFPLPDKLLLFGKISKDILKSKGYPESTLVPYGNPMFFDIENLKKINKPELIKKYNLPPNSNFILFAPPGMRIYKNTVHNFNLDILKKLLETINSNKNFFVIVKPHPSDDPNEYDSKLKGRKNVKILRDNLLELILLSDVIISSISTSIIDALCLERPVIKVIFDNMKMEQPYDSYAAVFESNLNEIPIVLNKILQNDKETEKKIQNAKQFVKDYYNIPNKNYKKLFFELIN